MTDLQLFQVVEKKCKAFQTNSRDKLPFVYLIKSLMFHLTTIPLPKRFILLYCLIAKVMYELSESFYKIEIERLVFKLCPVLFGWSFSKSSLAAHLGGKVEHLKY